MVNEQLLQEVRQLYAEYIEATVKLSSGRKSLGGFLGFGKRPGDDPCHFVFSDKLESALYEAAEEDPSSETVSALLSYIFEEPMSHQDKLAYWMLVAVQKHTEKLLPFLSRADAEPLARRFAELYPKNRRLPVQKTLAEELFRHAGISEGKGLSGIFGKHKGA